MTAAYNAPVLLITLIAASIASGALGTGGTSPPVEPSHTSVPFNRSSFPAGFIFGAGSAAYQVPLNVDMSADFLLLLLSNL